MLFTKIGLYRQVLIKVPSNKFDGNPSCFLVLRADGRAGMSKLLGALFLGGGQLFVASAQEDVVCCAAVGGVKFLCGKVMLTPNSVPILTRLNVTWVYFITDLQQ